MSSENPITHVEFRRVPPNMANFTYSVLTIRADGRRGPGEACDNFREAVKWRDKHYWNCPLYDMT